MNHGDGPISDLLVSKIHEVNRANSPFCTQQNAHKSHQYHLCNRLKKYNVDRSGAFQFEDREGTA